MLKRMIFPTLIGVIGCGILIWLGTWQLARMDWKAGILAEITAEITADPVPMPAVVDASMKYLPVTAEG